MGCPAARFTVQMRLVAVESDESLDRARYAAPEDPGSVLERLGPSLLALARARLHSLHDAQDAVQETCLRVLRGLDSYRPAAPFEHWVFTIAANVLRDFVRRRAVRQNARPPSTEVEVLRPDQALEQGDELARIRRALDRLDPEESAPLILHLIHGVPPKEIAAHLDIPVEHLRVRFFRAIRKVRNALGKE
jgi:RNA polymerase sigma factor (sigma-70 family)